MVCFFFPLKKKGKRFTCNKKPTWMIFQIHQIQVFFFVRVCEKVVGCCLLGCSFGICYLPVTVQKNMKVNILTWKISESCGDEKSNSLHPEVGEISKVSFGSFQQLGSSLFWWLATVFREELNIYPTERKKKEHHRPNIFYFHPYLGKIPILTNIFQMGWNHQPAETKNQPFDKGILAWS